MALFDNMAQECIKSELDLFTVSMTQTSIEKNSYVEIPPLSAITDSSPLEFIPGTGEDYIDLNKTLLYTDQNNQAGRYQYSGRRTCQFNKLPQSMYILTGGCFSRRSSHNAEF